MKSSEIMNTRWHPRAMQHDQQCQLFLLATLAIGSDFDCQGQYLVAPAVRPPTNWSVKRAYTATTGREASRAPAMSDPQ